MTLREFRESLREQRELFETVVRLAPWHFESVQLERRKKDICRSAGIIDAMTPAEREFPFAKIDGDRMRRIAVGAGIGEGEVAKFLKDIEEANVLFAQWRLGRNRPL